MTTSLNALPSDLAAAHAMILAERARMEAEAVAARACAVTASTDALIAHLRLEIEKLRRALYGRRSTYRSGKIVRTSGATSVRHILAACDIFILHSFEEPFGMVFVEAMAMKKPIVALDNGGAREIVEHGKSGLLSLPKDIEKLAEIR